MICSLKMKHYATQLNYRVATAVISTEIKEDKQKVQAVKKLIQQLPVANQDTMKHLFSHLLRYI